jgi:Methionyl-tRNA formyltransferase
MGRKHIAAESLRWLISLPNVKVVGVLTDDHLSISSTKDVADRAGIQRYSFEQAQEAIRAGLLSFDLGLSVLFWRILKGPLLNHPRLGVVNFHPAPLPQYKGLGGYNLAILEDRGSWGATAHYVDHGIDTGGIICVMEESIQVGSESVKSLERLTQSIIGKLVRDVVSRILEDIGGKRLPTVPNVGGRYVSRKELEDMKEVLPGDDVSKKIRAFWFPPYDGAYVMVNGVKCTLVDHSILLELADPDVSNVFSPPAQN